jgi:hypothetical protein
MRAALLSRRSRCRGVTGLRAAANADLLHDHRRLWRLFAALRDIARYTDGWTDARLLELSWGRIAELLQSGQPCGSCSRDNCALHEAVSRVADHPAGSPGWWQAVRLAARMSGVPDASSPGNSA